MATFDFNPAVKSPFNSIRLTSEFIMCYQKFENGLEMITPLDFARATT
jgi:hypothetical protein